MTTVAVNQQNSIKFTQLLVWITNFWWSAKTIILFLIIPNFIKLVYRIGTDGCDTAKMLSVYHLYKNKNKTICYYHYSQKRCLSIHIQRQQTSVVTEGINFLLVGLHSDQVCIINMVPSCTSRILHTHSKHHRLNVETTCVMPGGREAEDTVLQNSAIKEVKGAEGSSLNYCRHVRQIVVTIWQIKVNWVKTLHSAMLSFIIS